MHSAPAVASADLDFKLKLAAASVLSATGYSCRLNVALSAVADVGLADVTDIDVLAVTRDITFTQRVLCVSCKSGTNLAVARELFYLRGVLDYVRGDEAVLLLGGRDLTPHLRELASSLGVLALAKDEVGGWLFSLSNGTSPPGYFAEPLFAEYEKCMRAMSPSLGITSFLKADYWFYRDFRNVQNLIGHFRKFAPTLTGESRMHKVQYLDVAWHFAQTVLDICLHAQRSGVSRISETVNAHLFGGRTNYKARKDLLNAVTQLLSKTGVAKAASMPPLDPPYAAALAELVLRYIERPLAAILVPLVLQDAVWRDLGAAGFAPAPDKNALAAFKLAEDLVEFLRGAAESKWSPSLA